MTGSAVNRVTSEVLLSFAADAKRQLRCRAQISCSISAACHPEVLRRISVSSGVVRRGDPSEYLRMTIIAESRRAIHGAGASLSTSTKQSVAAAGVSITLNSASCDPHCVPRSADISAQPDYV